MDYSPLTQPARVSVSFKRSSTKDAGEGFDIDVSEGATEEEAQRVLKLALDLRQSALAALTGKGLVEQLEESLTNAS